MARAGKRVTWVLCEPTWGLIVDNELRKPCPAIRVGDAFPNLQKINTNDNKNNKSSKGEDKTQTLKHLPKNVDLEENNMLVQLDAGTGKKRGKEEEDEVDELELKRQRLGKC